MAHKQKTFDKQIIVLGDIEMGAGNLTDDFIADKTLAEMILNHAVKKCPIDLVLNGDTFDFLKCPSKLTPQSKFPRHISSEVSLQKLKLIYRAHKIVFKALEEFVKGKGKVVYFILGNHDHDLVYPEVQEKIRLYLKGTKNSVKFPGLTYKTNKVYIEHGHQYDFVFRINLKKLFLKYKGTAILNFPFVSFGLLGRMMKLKEDHPFMERISPMPELLTHHRVVMKKISKKSIGYFLKSLVYYPFRFYSDPTYSRPTHLLREMYRRIKLKHFDIDDVMTIFKKQKKRAKYKIYVLGHEHLKRISKGRKRVIILPGGWRDEYDFNSKTRELIPRTKRYVQIDIKNGEPSYVLVDLSLHRSILDFDEVIKDEIKYIHLAAKEEGYPLYLV
jgi:UDP-2,3-diacylglucosamine pyrophosphatase LpxH